MRGERGIRGFEQIVQKFLCGAMGGGDLELSFNVLAHDVRNGDGKFSNARGVQESTDVLETLQRDLEWLQRSRQAPPLLPAPSGIAAHREQRAARQ